MRFRILAMTTLLITLGIIPPTSAKVVCSFAESSVHCGDENNAWRQPYNDRDSDEKSRNPANFSKDINQLYREVLNRNVDENGLNTYTKALQKGKSLTWVRKKLVNSTEARENAIKQIYQEILEREADPTGLKTYIKALRRGWSLERVRRTIINSPEAKENAIKGIYKEILGREADPSGLKTYTRALQRGWSIQQVRREIIDSPEARTRRQISSNLPQT